MTETKNTNSSENPAQEPDEKHLGLYAVGRAFSKYHIGSERRADEPIETRHNGYQPLVPLSELAKDIADNITCSGEPVRRGEEDF